ncbi:Os12g0418600 [Oryza sativa Japonica Group]|uniref:Os12g0418600 protein n=1 Tax=Oryza sativa subsp. japonica TaxID=39947 RepID=Q0INP1_ORYSJ|nr:Os12g0418600 [Oryza sativa Japonica Group]|eukprot:NP_001066655.2 Os12g0418600 [Oryza sativa Japonica Group]
MDPDGYVEATGNLEAQDGVGSLESFGWFNRIIITPLYHGNDIVASIHTIK